MPDDVFQCDLNRILIRGTIGDVQAWRPDFPGDTAIAFSFYASFQHKGETRSYTSSSHNLTVADARDLAAQLLKAADHAESLTQAEAA